MAPKVFSLTGLLLRRKVAVAAQATTRPSYPFAPSRPRFSVRNFPVVPARDFSSAPPPEKKEEKKIGKEGEVSEARPRLYRGVREGYGGRYGAQIRTHGRTIWLGTYASEKEAALVVDEAVLRYRGPRARFNFPTEICLHQIGLADALKRGVPEALERCQQRADELKEEKHPKQPADHASGGVLRDTATDQRAQQALSAKEDASKHRCPGRRQIRQHKKIAKAPLERCQQRADELEEEKHPKQPEDHASGGGLRDTATDQPAQQVPSAKEDASKHRCPGRRQIRQQKKIVKAPWRFRGVRKQRSGRHSGEFAAWLGSYNTKEEAGHAYDDAAWPFYRDLRRLNYPERFFRVASKQQREAAQRSSKETKVRLYGVRKRKSGFAAELVVWCGCYDTPEEAGQAVDVAAVRHYGRTRPDKLNFPEICYPEPHLFISPKKYALNAPSWLISGRPIEASLESSTSEDPACPGSGSSSGGAHEQVPTENKRGEEGEGQGFHGTESPSEDLKRGSIDERSGDGEAQGLHATEEKSEDQDGERFSSTHDELSEDGEAQGLHATEEKSEDQDGERFSSTHDELSEDGEGLGLYETENTGEDKEGAEFSSTDDEDGEGLAFSSTEGFDEDQEQPPPTSSPPTEHPPRCEGCRFHMKPIEDVLERNLHAMKVLVCEAMQKSGEIERSVVGIWRFILACLIGGTAVTFIGFIAGIKFVKSELGEELRKLQDRLSPLLRWLIVNQPQKEEDNLWYKLKRMIGLSVPQPTPPPPPAPGIAKRFWQGLKRLLGLGSPEATPPPPPAPGSLRKIWQGLKSLLGLGGAEPTPPPPPPAPGVLKRLWQGLKSLIGLGGAAVPAAIPPPTPGVLVRAWLELKRLIGLSGAAPAPPPPPPAPKNRGVFASALYNMIKDMVIRTTVPASAPIPPPPEEEEKTSGWMAVFESSP